MICGRIFFHHSLHFWKHFEEAVGRFPSHFVLLFPLHKITIMAKRCNRGQEGRNAPYRIWREQTAATWWNLIGCITPFILTHRTLAKAERCHSSFTWLAKRDISKVASDCSSTQGIMHSERGVQHKRKGGRPKPVSSDFIPGKGKKKIILISEAHCSVIIKWRQ